MASRRTGAALAAAAAALALAGCGSGGRGPAAVATVTLPHPDTADRGVVLPVRTVTLRAGQTFAVLDTDGVLSSSYLWYARDEGDRRVVHRTGQAAEGDCGSPPRAGCSPAQRFTYTAVAPGTTTVTWAEGRYPGCAPGSYLARYDLDGVCTNALLRIRIVVTAS